MRIIEDFAELSEQEQLEFAEDLISEINNAHIFSSSVDFEVTSVTTNNTDGGLLIEASHTEVIEVSRAASWQADDEDAAHCPAHTDIDYNNSVYKDAAKAFNTKKATINGYTVSLDIEEVEEDEIVEVEIDTITDEDSGIGSYEYFGFTGYDSNPYVEVEGTIIQACTCTLSFFVEYKDVT